MQKKLNYERPQIEVVEFEIEEQIAQSTATRSFWGTLGAEDIWGDE
jgi:hypothetical protein